MPTTKATAKKPETKLDTKSVRFDKPVAKPVAIAKPIPAIVAAKPVMPVAKVDIKLDFKVGNDARRR